MSTEARNPRSTHLDRMSAIDIVRLMNEEDQAILVAIKSAENSIAIAAERMARAYQAGGRIIYVGAGTSGRIATADAAEMPPTFSVEPNRFIAVVAGGSKAQTAAIERAEDDEHAAVEALNEVGITPDDLVFGISASGKTPFTVSGVRHAHQKGAWTCGIANTRNTPLLKAADHAICLLTGPEVLTGSTRLKAGTSQKIALNAISTAAMVLCGKVVENLMVDVKATNAKLRERCVKIVHDLTTLSTDEAQQALEKCGYSIRDVLKAERNREGAAGAWVD